MSERGPAGAERANGSARAGGPATVARIFFVCFCFFTLFPIYLFHDRVECMIFNTMHMVLYECSRCILQRFTNVKMFSVTVFVRVSSFVFGGWGLR